MRPTAGWPNGTRLRARASRSGGMCARPLVGCLEPVPRISRAMHRDEVALHVAIEPALADLVGLDLDEGVVPTFGSHPHLHDAERPLVGAAPLTRHRAHESELPEEFIRQSQRLGGRELRAMKVT